MTTETRRIILSSVGVNSPQESEYALGDSTATTYYSSLALWNLVPELKGAAELWFILTEKASATHWTTIQEQAARHGFDVHKIDISGDEDDVEEFLTKTANALPDNCSVALNITEGLRHHAFLYYALALYLTAFKNISIDGVWYCRFETNRQSRTPKALINLQSVFELAEWFYSLRLQRDTGSYSAIAKMTQDTGLKDKLNGLSAFIMNGMPIEAGDAAKEFSRKIQGRHIIEGVPFAEELDSSIRDRVQKLAINANEVRTELLPEELERQAILIDHYFEKRQWNLALGLVKEYVVSWIASKSQESRKKWLHRRTREAIERKIGLLLQINNASSEQRKRLKERFTEGQRTWAGIWDDLTALRNKLQHHGMNPDAFNPSSKQIQRAEEFWRNRDNWPTDYQFTGGTDRLLICPLGNSPGVLSSAISYTKPRRLLVICSASTKQKLDEAIMRGLGLSPDVSPELEYKILEMRNPHAGFDEFTALIEESLLWLAESSTVMANLTGGTSLMGVLVSQLAKEARNLQRSVEEFVLIDEREPAEQQKEPWKISAIHYLSS